jgi:hypothetical protein
VTVPVLIRLCIAVAVCAAILSLTALYDVLFLPEWNPHEITEEVTPDGQVVVGIAHVYRIPPMAETILRIAIPILALVGVAAYVSRLVVKHRVLSGALATMCAALITLIVLQIDMALRLDLSFVPRTTTVLIWASVSLSIGAAVSWLLGVWWPNNSFERTREG